MTAKLLFLAGSARKDSCNKKLAKYAHSLATKLGAQATFIDLADFPMPIYDGDLEQASGLPEHAKRLKKIFIEHDGLFIASPEYNSSLAPLLKNALDWISRIETPNETSLAAYQNKVAAICAASPGGYGGMRGLVVLRMMLGNINVQVIPNQLAIADAFNAFDENGALKNAAQTDMLNGIVKRLHEVTTALKK